MTARNVLHLTTLCMSIFMAVLAPTPMGIAWAQVEGGKETEKTPLQKFVDNKVATVNTPLGRVGAISTFLVKHAKPGVEIPEGVVTQLMNIVDEEDGATVDGFAFPHDARSAASRCLAIVAYRTIVLPPEDVAAKTLAETGEKISGLPVSLEATPEMLERTKARRVQAIVKFLHSTLTSGNFDNVVAAAQALARIPGASWPDTTVLADVLTNSRVKLYAAVTEKNVDDLFARGSAAEALVILENQLRTQQLQQPNAANLETELTNRDTTTAEKIATLLDAENLMDRIKGAELLGRMGFAAHSQVDRLEAILLGDATTEADAVEGVRQAVVHALPALVERNTPFVSADELLERRKRVVRMYGRTFDEKEFSFRYSVLLELAQFNDKDIAHDTFKVLTDRALLRINPEDPLEHAFLVKALGALGANPDNKDLRPNIRKLLIDNIDMFLAPGPAWSELRDALLKLR